MQTSYSQNSKFIYQLYLGDFILGHLETCIVVEGRPSKSLSTGKLENKLTLLPALCHVAGWKTIFSKTKIEFPSEVETVHKSAI